MADAALQRGKDARGPATLESEKKQNRQQTDVAQDEHHPTAQPPRHERRVTHGSTSEKSGAAKPKSQKGASGSRPCAVAGAAHDGYRIGFSDLEQALADHIQRSYDNSLSTIEQFEMMKSDFAYFKAELSKLVKENINGVRVEAKGALE